MSDRRILFMHAHPDDESINTGATMARYAAEGAHVTLVTCTLGEEGEIIPPEYADLASDRQDRLGEHRVSELADACAALGVTDHRFLGGAGRWRDSGMAGVSSNDRPGAFWHADVDEAAALLEEIVREVRPQVIVTYDDDGYYGHPDHIQAHRVSWRVFEKSQGTDWQIDRFYAIAMPRSVLARSVAVLKASSPFRSPGSVDELPYGVPDDQVTTAIDCRAYLPRKLAALAAHHTQITVEGSHFALSNKVGQQAFGVEYYTRLAGPEGPLGPDGREHDLFGGLT
ncbi:N-acetyl-1-D-myo-inositol-2-amino-2-deoxy-alpha-D-glucopyranoside deacetylase [Actinocorallia populi]|uniref:N-acetyl-1-D-myo-inositol-2-amino-2-deoxy-alpha- D-glucopyranoside deacetylase n=1 Tax=Actinocorallia populi TaxID=2079200 RepID=UPI000D0969DA|nr:N-acetyl-1-D-myo-inositol-2-amino-2-deoxy-alpha-D-glucopyranoside deacetylase [Actinocorallia populi]